MTPYYFVCCCIAVDEEITMESLMVMTEETLKCVIPKAGPRSLLIAVQDLVS
jgi:hypothetical protein